MLIPKIYGPHFFAIFTFQNAFDQLRKLSVLKPIVKVYFLDFLALSLVPSRSKI